MTLHAPLAVPALRQMPSLSVPSQVRPVEQSGAVSWQGVPAAVPSIWQVNAVPIGAQVVPVAQRCPGSPATHAPPAATAR